MISAGVLLYRRQSGGPEVLLVHPGGPFWARKDDGAWSVPKGMLNPGEDERAGARREFQEETGFEVDVGADAYDLGTFAQPSGKRLRIWAVAGECDPAQLSSNLFEMEWPPRSGRRAEFPEVDRGDWFAREAALRKITPGQRAVLEKFYGAFSDFASTCRSPRSSP